MILNPQPSPLEYSLSINADCTPFINFAMQQNAVPLLRALSVTNYTGTQVSHGVVRVWSDPPILAEKILRVDAMAAGEVVSFTDLTLTLLREPLRRQSEREEGHVWIEASADGVEPCRRAFPLSVLAYNEWFGASSLPEILAAHVLPNDPAVEIILAEASKLLLEKTGDGSLSGYQSRDPKRAYAQAAAIYIAAARQKFSYINPPASFENTGQKIRTPENMLERKLGTCLDTSVLLAACFEQAGLRPVVVLVKGHAFAGVWLVDTSFDDTVTRHASILLNRIGLGEFLALETTGIAKTPPLTLKAALAEAKAHLQNEESFHFAVDVTAARKSGIRPLSLTEGAIVGAGDGGVVRPADGFEPVFDDLSAPADVAEAVVSDPARPPRDKESPADRLARWKNSLLDLSLRNRLLNFKDSKKSIPLLCPDIAALEDALAADAAFRVRPRPDAWAEADPRDATLYQAQTGENALADYLNDEMARKRLHAAVTESDLAGRLTEIERAARLGLEEGGANTLFLALGFLVFKESGAEGVERRAPILLIPMSIERKAVRDGFRIRRIDEESRINITLLKKLKADFGITVDGLDPLPEDDSGLDVPKILRTIRDAIKREPGWTVTDEASLTILTFSRFLMWLDLEANAEVLKQNPVVRHLVESSNAVFEPGAEFPVLENLDDRYPPSETFCPLPADSSQLRAVFAAAEGRTFVLQGPPGTGKSQTITNLIAHGLACGMRVLFVAQKRAALDVVHRRLADTGFGPFCLELHSNKTTKESFRTQLRDALTVAGSAGGENWARETALLGEQRKILNRYVRELHLPRSFGKSAYGVISRLIDLDGQAKVALDLGDPEGRTVEEFDTMCAAVRELAEAARVSGDPAAHPLQAVRLASYAWGVEADAENAIQSAGEALKHLLEFGPFLKNLGLDADRASSAVFWAAHELTGLLSDGPFVTPALLAESDWVKVKNALSEWIDMGRNCSKGRSELLLTYTNGIFSLDLGALIGKLAARKDAWFFRRWRLGVAVRKTVQTVRADLKKPKDPDALADDLGKAMAVAAEINRLNADGGDPALYFGASWQGAESCWDGLQTILDWTDTFRKLLDRAPGGDIDAKLKIRGRWIRLATEGRALFAVGTPAGERGRTFRDALEDVRKKRSHVDRLLNLDVEKAWGRDDEGRMAERAGSFLRGLSEHLSRLREWSHYQAARASVEACRLSPLAMALEEGKIKAQDFGEVFDHSFADWWARNVLRSVPALSGFIGERHDLKIREFREQEAKVADLARKEAFARIAGSMPRMAAGQNSPASSETGLLQRFAQGGRKTIRRIFKECPNALARYKPCVLMSPLSVAQFIGADFPGFDLVVFDEASQMPTYDAIGAIARGKRLIVVGDSRQLPPTRFFEKQKGDDDVIEEDIPEDLESILEEAEAAGLKTLSLDWHYRSRHESLIAFSNRQYYGNRLLTFPSAHADHPRLGVRWSEVPAGVYDHGKTRTNRKEAEAVVAEIVRRLRDPKEQGESLGVVTFSQAQQGLVEDLLDTARGEFPEIEPYFTSVGEPVFVKNLETVQGDERDVILFSICYGPDETGTVRMNFGPLNNKGGERRLNVAVTRARKQLLVFSRLRPEQIDLSRTKATGVHHLRTFLDYARRGPLVMEEGVSPLAVGTESFLEKSIGAELSRRGYRVDAQVGCSGYRIDLAIRDSDDPGRYILGVECDGPNYRNAKSARDRDRLRHSVLEGLGWSLHRIWSTDWWLQRSKEIEKLEKALAQAKLRATNADDGDLTPPSNVPVIVSGADSSEDQALDEKLANVAPSIARKRDLAPVVSGLPGQSVYRRFDLNGRTFPGELHDAENAGRVRALVQEVVLTEAPVLFDSLCSVMASAWGLQRAGSRVRDIAGNAVMQNGFVFRRSGDREFIWTGNQAEKPYEGFRVPAENEAKARTAVEICPEEAANAAAQVLALHISMSREDLMRETAGVFGITRLGAKVRSCFEEGIEYLANKGGCRIEGETVVAC